MLKSDKLPRGDLWTAIVDAWQSESLSEYAIGPYNGIYSSMTFAWYALNTKPRKEEFLWEQCLAHGYENIYPRLRVQPVNPRARKIRPYFPGYLFVHVDLERVNLSRLRWMPGAARVVTFGGAPATVPDGLIHAIQRRVEEVNAAGGELFDGLKSGDAVYYRVGLLPATRRSSMRICPAASG